MQEIDELDAAAEAADRRQLRGAVVASTLAVVAVGTASLLVVFGAR